MEVSKERYSRHVSLWRKINAILWLLPAWFAPHYKLRAFFHRLRGVKMYGHVFIGYYCTLDQVHPEMIELHNRSVVCANSVILTHDDFVPKATSERQANLKKVVLEEGATLGIGCMVMPGVTIGKHSIVGAYSVVTRDVPPGTVCILPRKHFSVKMPKRD